MNFFNPLNWLIFLEFFLSGRKCTRLVHQKYRIDRTICMWIIPCGLFGYWIKNKLNKKYDVWALGSDVWKVRKIPFLGKYWIKKIVKNASGVFADGIQLASDVKAISGKDCQFLPSTRKLPKPENELTPLEPVDACHLLFIGRYHKNKGPDLLINAIAEIEENKRKKLKVHLFGAGPLETHLHEMCGLQQLTSVISIHGPIKDQECANYLSQVSFLVIPSRVESIPLVFSDAMQAQTPVIATPVGDLKDLVPENQCGFIASAIEPKALARSIEEGMDSRREQFRQATAKMASEFSMSRIAQRWLGSTP
jgi:glycosyltransferase involved in cell wall biosynthesis